MLKIKLAGVPEHFNYPWIQGIQQGLFESVGLDVQWINVPEGTGKLCAMLRANEIDVAIVLTEGIFKEISEGNPAVIVQKFVESPLLWGIHVAATSPYYSVADLQYKKAAISRIGSGSQLMAHVNAHNQGWKNVTAFEIVHTIHGAVDALTSQKADYFMWEHFMTKPLVDQGIFRRLADCPTPWPCFVIAVRHTFLANQLDGLKKLLHCINSITSSCKQDSTLVKNIAERYQLQPEDVAEWLAQTTWSQHNFEPEAFEKIQSQLLQFSILSNQLAYEKTIYTIC